MNVYDQLKKLGITLPQAPAKGGIYSPVRVFGSFAYCSGCGPDQNGVSFKKGKVGAEISLEEAQAAARGCLLNILAVIERELGDLNRVKSFAKMLAFVASSDDFYDQPMVANGASALLVEIFGEETGLPARSAIGVNVLPGNIPVEIEMLFELRD